MHKFGKAFNIRVMSHWKLSHLFKNEFGFTPKFTGGVRWYLECEQINKIDQIWVNLIMTQLI